MLFKFSKFIYSKNHINIIVEHIYHYDRFHHATSLSTNCLLWFPILSHKHSSHHNFARSQLPKTNPKNKHQAIQTRQSNMISCCSDAENDVGSAWWLSIKPHPQKKKKTPKKPQDITVSNLCYLERHLPATFEILENMQKWGFQWKQIRIDGRGTWVSNRKKIQKKKVAAGFRVKVTLRQFSTNARRRTSRTIMS